MNIYKFIFVVILVTSSLYSQPQWEQLNSGINTNLMALYFLSDDVGWVVGDNGVIIKTTNGGTTWNQQTSNTNLDLLSVYFRDELHGWIGGTGGLLLATTDGGEEWNSSTIALSNEKVYSVEFIDENTGYAIVGYVDYYGNYYGYILKTSDGGNSWISKFSIYGDALMNVFTHGDHAWAIGTGVEAHTTNYGEYWNLIYTPDDQWLFDVYFCNDLIGYAVGGNDNTEIIIKTTNGGSFWYISKETHPYARLMGVYFTDVNRGWAVGWNRRILFTTDGGSNWIPQNSPVSNNLRKVQFTARNIGYIVGDGGVILKYSSPPITVLDPNGGEIISAGSDYYIEWNSVDVADVKLDYSTDNGSTWITILDSIPSTGIYDWTVPNTFTSLGRVRISDITDSTVFDISDGPFTIQSSHMITVTDPNGGEELQGGSTYEINWTSNDVEYVKIEYSINNGATWNSVVDSIVLIPS
jgi:photosystem II stability/assembly factor-like uncharacterized protein